MKTACYIPALEGESALLEGWVADAASRFPDVTPVLLPPVDWNDDLTPWPAAPIFRKGKSFGGKATSYLQQLEQRIIPLLEADLGFVPDQRWFIGISLAGLFGVWASARTGLFQRIAAVSGSFWYPGFPAWFAGQTIRADAFYISLGNREAQSKNPHLQSIEEDTAAVVDSLRIRDIPLTFEWTEGTHFGPILPRLDKALAALRDAPAGGL